MTTHIRRAGLRESWEEYRLRTGKTRQQWREEGWRLLAWPGPGTPCTTSNGTCVDESQGEARSDAS